MNENVPENLTADENAGKGLAIASMACGIASVVLGLTFSCCCGVFGMILPAILSIVAIVLAVLSKKEAGTMTVLAKVGLIIGITSVAMIVLLVVVSIVLSILGMGIDILGILMENL